MTKYFEDKYTELKCDLIDEVKNEIIAFLNSDGGSVIGFDDDQSKDQIDLKLENWIQEAFFLSHQD